MYATGCLFFLWLLIGLVRFFVINIDSRPIRYIAHSDRITSPQEGLRKEKQTRISLGGITRSVTLRKSDL